MNNKAPQGFLRHPSGRYTLHYYPGIAATVNLRIYDLNRTYVPRRLTAPIASLTDVMQRPDYDASPYLENRTRAPALFPGAGYPLHSGTGIRGRILRADSSPVRWAYIEARPLSTDDTIPALARARGDDRGEFLLLLPPNAVPANDLPASFQLRVEIWAPATQPLPAQPGITDQDLWWDLPLEVITEPQQIDQIAPGRVIPPTYVRSAPVQNVTFQLDRLLTSLDIGDLTFTPA